MVISDCFASVLTEIHPISAMRVCHDRVRSDRRSHHCNAGRCDLRLCSTASIMIDSSLDRLLSLRWRMTDLCIGIIEILLIPHSVAFCTISSILSRLLDIAMMRCVCVAGSLSLVVSMIVALITFGKIEVISHSYLTACSREDDWILIIWPILALKTRVSWLTTLGSVIVRRLSCNIYWSVWKSCIDGLK